MDNPLPCCAKSSADLKPQMASKSRASIKPRWYLLCARSLKRYSKNTFITCRYVLSIAFSRSSEHTYIIILTLLCFTNRTDILHKWKTYCSTVVGRGAPTRLFRDGAESDWGNQLPTFDLSKEKVLRSAETKAKEYMRRYPGLRAYKRRPRFWHIPTKFPENQTQYAQWSTAVMSRIGLLWPGAPRSLGHAQASLRCTQLPMQLAKIVRNENSPAKPCQSKSVVNVATTKHIRRDPAFKWMGLVSKSASPPISAFLTVTSARVKRNHAATARSKNLNHPTMMGPTRIMTGFEAWLILIDLDWSWLILIDLDWSRR